MHNGGLFVLRDRYAVISVGTNSTRYLLADFSGKRFRFFGQPITRVIDQKSVGTRIGEGLRETGTLSDAAMVRTLETISAHFTALQGHYEHLFVIATSAVRRANNSAVFIERVRKLTGKEVQVLSGDDEARCAFRGAVMSVPHAESQRIGVLDTGGGSTEYAVGDHDHADQIVSAEIGAVRLTEEFPELAGDRGEVSRKVVERARTKAREKLAPLAGFERGSEVVFVGGSATATAALIRGHRGRFAHVSFTQAALRGQFERLIGLSLKKRKKIPGINVQRADILPAGMIILDTVFELLRHDHATVSTTDLLYGFLLLEHEAAESADVR